MRNVAKLSLIFLATAVSSGSACCMFGTFPSVYLPNVCSILFSAFSRWWWPTSRFRAPAPVRHLKYDMASGTWTYNCPSTRECQYGVDQGDPDACPQCLLGPKAACSNWGGHCGNGLMCKFAGPMACSGECVWEHEFYSRNVEETCGDWDGNCAAGLHCKYDECSAAMLPYYGSVMHLAGRCVAEEAFHSRREGQTCSDLAGLCTSGLECRASAFPWCPSTCVAPDNAFEAPDGGIISTQFVSVVGNDLGLSVDRTEQEVTLTPEENEDDDVVVGVIEIVLPVDDGDRNDDFITFPGVDQTIQEAVLIVKNNTSYDLGFDVIEIAEQLGVSEELSVDSTSFPGLGQIGLEAALMMEMENGGGDVGFDVIETLETVEDESEDILYLSGGEFVAQELATLMEGNGDVMGVTVPEIASEMNLETEELEFIVIEEDPEIAGYQSDSKVLTTAENVTETDAAFEAMPVIDINIEGNVVSEELSEFIPPVEMDSNAGDDTRKGQLLE